VLVCFCCCGGSCVLVRLRPTCFVCLQQYECELVRLRPTYSVVCLQQCECELVRLRPTCSDCVCCNSVSVSMYEI